MEASVEDTVEIIEETVALKRLRQAVRAQRDLARIVARARPPGIAGGQLAGT
ncbi:MAG: hypothetical protein R3E68_04210 [Burkholderiaceae bacterium]